MSTSPPNARTVAELASGAWRLDPARSSVEFHARNFYGLMTVKGLFERYQGTFDLRAEPAATLTVEAASLDTKQAKRDKHLRSADFFDVEQHPQVRFVSDHAALEGSTVKLKGALTAAGRTVPVELDAVLRAVEDELDIEGSVKVNQRDFGMIRGPMGILGAKLLVRGRLVRHDETSN